MTYNYYMTEAALRELESAGYQMPELAGRIIEASHSVPSSYEAQADARDALRAAVARGDSEAARIAGDRCALAIGGGFDHTVMIARSCMAELLIAFDMGAAWAFFAGEYNAAGMAFGKAVKAVDPDADAGWIASEATTAQRTAWAGIPRMVSDLERLTALLIVCRDLEGQTTRFPRDAGQSLGLCANPDEADVVELLKAWSAPSESRAGRWGDIVKLGATLQAPATMDGLVTVEPAPDVEPQRQWVGASSGVSGEVLSAFVSLTPGTDARRPPGVPSSESGMDGFAIGAGLR